MQQVKLFKSLESDINSLEAEVNGWLRESGVKVLSITGNIAPQSQTPGDTKGGLQTRRFPPSVCREPTIRNREPPGLHCSNDQVEKRETPDSHHGSEIGNITRSEQLKLERQLYLHSC